MLSPRGLVLLALVAVVAGVTALGLVGLWSQQRRLLYFPSRYERAAAEREARAREFEPWTEGGELLGWVRRSPGARGRLVVFHGNAGSALDRTYFAEALAWASPAVPLDVYLAEYPGYGPRPGSPSEPAILAAAREQLAAARRAGEGPLLVAGESLGGAVAVLAAVEPGSGVEGLLLVAPLASVPAVARRHYPIAPAFMVRDDWRADLALPRHRGRLVMIIAGRDEVVFPDLDRALFEGFPGPKRLWIDPEATHNTLDWRPELARWREIVEFLAGPR